MYSKVSLRSFSDCERPNRYVDSIKAVSSIQEKGASRYLSVRQQHLVVVEFEVLARLISAGSRDRCFCQSTNEPWSASPVFSYLAKARNQARCELAAQDAALDVVA